MLFVQFSFIIIWSYYNTDTHTYCTFWLFGFWIEQITANPSQNLKPTKKKKSVVKTNNRRALYIINTLQRLKTLNFSKNTYKSIIVNYIFDILFPTELHLKNVHYLLSPGSNPTNVVLVIVLSMITGEGLDNETAIFIGV